MGKISCAPAECAPNFDNPGRDSEIAATPCRECTNSSTPSWVSEHIVPTSEGQKERLHLLGFGPFLRHRDCRKKTRRSLQGHIRQRCPGKVPHKWLTYPAGAMPHCCLLTRAAPMRVAASQVRRHIPQGTSSTWGPPAAAAGSTTSAPRSQRSGAIQHAARRHQTWPLRKNHMEAGVVSS